MSLKKRPSRNELEALRQFIGDLMARDLGPRAERDGTPLVLATARSHVGKLLDEVLASAPDPATHRPVEYAALTLGCSCGFRPAAPSKRMSTHANAYNAHLRKLNIDPYTSWRGSEVQIRWGQHAGKTSAEAYPGLFR